MDAVLKNWMPCSQLGFGSSANAETFRHFPAGKEENCFAFFSGSNCRPYLLPAVGARVVILAPVA